MPKHLGRAEVDFTYYDAMSLVITGRFPLLACPNRQEDEVTEKFQLLALILFFN